MNKKKEISIMGAGLMGHGIAQVFAYHGHNVRVYDTFSSSLDSLHERIKSNLRDLDQPTQCVERVKGFSSLPDAVAGADVIFECAPEKREIKQKLFAEIEAHAPVHALVASNTSVMPIAWIVEGLSSAARMMGTHWWNPPFLIPLVEVVGTTKTEPHHIGAMITLLTAVGKTAVHVKKDVAGFVGNRLQHALWREAIAIVAEGICDARTVDTVIKKSFGRRLAVLGPLENSDMIGNDLTLDIHKTIIPELDRSIAPHPYLRHLIDEGKLGVKSHEGFMTWSGDEAAALRKKVFNHLKKVLDEDVRRTDHHGFHD
jgi:3-hydroxybutyryl-CoA dehydrogenase